MSKLAQALSQLRLVRGQLQSELAEVESAIGALQRISPGKNGRGAGGRGRPRRNRLSPAARARIAAAQRARWAKVRQQKQKAAA